MMMREAKRRISSTIVKYALNTRDKRHDVGEEKQIRRRKIVFSGVAAFSNVRRIRGIMRSEYER